MVADLCNPEHITAQCPTPGYKLFIILVHMHMILEAKFSVTRWVYSKRCCLCLYVVEVILIICYVTDVTVKCLI